MTRIIHLATLVVLYLTVQHTSADQLTKGYYYRNYRNLSPHYTLQFGIIPYGNITEWSNIVYFFAGSEAPPYRNPVPAVFFLPGTTKLHICTGLSGNKDYCWSDNNDLSIGKRATIRLSQKPSERKIYFTVYVNGKKKLRIENDQAQHYRNVICYLADPWYNPANADVSRFQFTQTFPRHE